MVTELVKLQLKRLNRQKFVYLYLIVLFALTIGNLRRCIGSSGDAGMEYYAGGKFLTLCMQSYIDMVGPLFLSFISAVLISGEKATGMFRQPLLNGATNNQLLLAKVFSVLMIALVCFLFQIIFSIGVGFSFWGKCVFENMQEGVLQILLLSVPQITMVLFFVLLSLYMSNISSMMCASLMILLINNLFSQFFGGYIRFVDFMYYLYPFSEYNGMAFNTDTIVTGIMVNAVTIPILIGGMMKRMEHMAL